VGAGGLGGGRERPGEHLAEVDRPAEVVEQAIPPELLLGRLPRPGELTRELVDPGVQRHDQLGHAAVGAARGAAHQEDRHDDRDERETCQRACEQKRHRDVPSPPESPRVISL
jgi:hypothetical protein